MAELMRLQKFLAHQGYGSRRSVEKMISDKRITINGTLITEQGTKVDPDTDQVRVDNDLVQQVEELVYFWLNKPVGVVSSRASQDGEPTVIDLVETTYWVYPVGRLDKDSRGLLLLTNDGLLTHKLTHPKFHIDKTYEVCVTGKVTEKKLNHLRNGVRLEEGTTAPAQVDLIDSTSNTRLRFIIHEGKNRQIRRMCEIVGLSVVDLVRVSFGPITLGNLKEGAWKKATSAEINTLRNLVGIE